MQFKASLDALSKGITWAITLITFVLIIFILIVLKNDRILILLPVGILSLTLAGTFLFSPQSYEITNDHIEISRKINIFRIPRAEIISIEKLSEEDMGRAWRMMGNGGMFGYTGWFRSAKQGKMRWFVTQRKNYISIVLADQRKYILSPDDPTGFLQAIQW